MEFHEPLILEAFTAKNREGVEGFKGLGKRWLGPLKLESCDVEHSKEFLSVAKGGLVVV
jgi:hypothetical protein